MTDPKSQQDGAGHGPQAQPQSAGMLIVGALAMGVLVFTAVAAYLVTSGTMGGEGSGLGLPAIPVAAGLSVVALTAPFLIRPLLAAKVARRSRAAREEVESGRIPPELLSATIVAGAVSEAPGLLGATLALVEGDLTYLVPAGAAVITLLALLPTRGRLEGLLDR
ncbi:MAG: hypothetical protein AAFP22_07010 [Planctomycetota bacterium]